jgi:beta-galactosidase GanA
MNEMPKVADRSLIVDGSPILLLAAELHNSSSSTKRSMAARWPRLRDAGITTVLAAVAWEQVEPDEGIFDFTVVDDLLAGARAHDMRLVLLWFGSWKNGVSTYVPAWVKRNPARFLRQTLGGSTVPVLSPFCSENLAADSRAFAALMGHLRDHDPEHTVILVQVENEVGSLGDSRDRSAGAEGAWRQAVPSALIGHLSQSTGCCGQPAVSVLGTAPAEGGIWAAVFGDTIEAEEIFMAWHLASYIGSVAAAGRAQKDLPMFVNGWLNADPEEEGQSHSGGTQPGAYPSGGPLPHVAAAWHVAAPAIDFLAPDIYISNFAPFLQRYAELRGPLLVPEVRPTREGLQVMFEAIGSHGAIGVAPFGADEMYDADHDALRQANRQLAALSQDILAAQGKGTIKGFAVNGAMPVMLELPGFRFAVMRDLRFDGVEGDAAYGLLLHLGDGQFVVAGYGFTIFATTATGGPVVLHSVQELDLDSATTGHSDDLAVLRWLNGDETMSGIGVRVSAGEPSRFPGGIPASRSISGVVRFSVIALDAE